MTNPKNPGTRTLNPVETIAALAFALSLIGILFHLEWMPYAVVTLLFLGLFVKRASRFLADLWMRFAVFLGNMNSRIILTIVFFLFLTPIAWVYRLVKGDTLKLKRNNFASSHWHERDHRFTADDLEKIF